MLTSLFSLFYITGEFHRFLHQGRAEIPYLCTTMFYSPDVQETMECVNKEQERQSDILKGYYHLHSTVKRERFFAHVYFSDNCVDWTNENVLFGAQNNECLSKKRGTFCEDLYFFIFN